MIMADAGLPCKGQSDQFLKLHERGAKLIALNPDKSPSNGFVAATREDIQSHGDFGIFPISAGLVCIDVDEGDPQPILDIAYSMGITPVLHPTGRGWHLWIHGRVTDNFAYWSFEHADCRGEIRLGGGPGKGAYCKIWEAWAILDALNLPPANTDTLTDFVHLLRGEIRRSRAPAAVSRPRPTAEGQKRGKSSFLSFYSDSGSTRRNPPKTAPGPFHLKMAGYWVGNRMNKFNSDVWHLTLMGKDISAAIGFARQSGLEDDEIARTIKSTVAAAQGHWYWRLMNGKLDTKGLTNRQGDTVLRVLQSIARGADWSTGKGSRFSRATIAKNADCSVPTVKRAIRKLLKLGLIRKDGWHVVSRKEYKGSKKSWENRVIVYDLDLDLLKARMAA